MTEFTYSTYLQTIHFGPGALEQLPAALDALGPRRVLLTTTRSARHAGRAERVEALLGQRWVGTFDHTLPHVQQFQVSEVAEQAARLGADLLLGLGGGSALGLAKAVAYELIAAPRALEHSLVAAIPTTYAGSEMTPIFGVTHEAGGVSRKVTVNDARIVPRLVLYDPAFTLDLPPDLTASSGLNALAHCAEAVYSITRHPLSTAAALAGARAIARSLPRCWANGADLEARTEMLLGAHLAGASLAGVSLGLHHGLCHVLGGTAGVPHGVANAIILPHALRFNREAAAPHLAALAEAMGAAPPGAGAHAAAAAAIAFVEELVASLDLPRRLRDAGVPKSSLPRLAELAAQSKTVQSNPKPPSAAEVEALLRAAW